MRLEFEPTATVAPPIQNDLTHDGPVSPDHQVLLKKGISAAQAGDRALAHSLLEQAVDLQPACTDAWMWLASIAEYPEELLACLNKVLGAEPENARAREWHAATLSLLAKTFVGRGIDAHEHGDDDGAMQFFDRAIEHDHDCETAWFWKASLAGEDDMRVEYLRRVLSINPDNTDATNSLDKIVRSRVSAQLDQAKAAAASGDHNGAMEILEQVVDRDENNVDAWMLRSHLSADLTDKLHSLEKVLAIQPDNAAARASYDFLSSTIAVVAKPTPVELEEEAVECHDEANDFEPASEMDAVEDVPSVDETEMEFEPEAEPVYFDDSEDEEGVENIDPFKTIVGVSVSEMMPDERSVEDEPVVESSPAIESEAEPDHISEPGYDDVYSVEANEEFRAPSSDDFFGYSHEDQGVGENVTDECIAVEEVVENLDTEVAADEVSVAEIFEQTQNAYEDEPAAFNTEPEQEVSEVTAVAGVPCPFCWENNQPQAIECGSCHATLTFTDLEALISNPRADRTTVQTAVTQMEAEWNLREFTADELISLGIGHFNLGNYGPGVKYLQEASLMRPNDVILSGHINTLVIRLDEVRRQNEINDTRPKGRTILVVDDSATVRKLISGKLEKSGHTVMCAEDGIEGIARIRERMPDLVLLDITMPRMDGYEVCRQIRSNPDTKDIPVVMISGKDGFFDKVRGRMAGTTAYITKPFGPETLMKALETYLTEEGRAQSLAELEEEPVAV